MYINSALGGVALVVVWLYLKKILVRDDTLKESPAAMLEQEIAKHRVAEEERLARVERLHAAAVERRDLVAAALEELREALPENARGCLSWEKDGDSVLVFMRDAEGNAKGALNVAWRVHHVDLQAPFDEDDASSGAYALLHVESGKEETVWGLDACMRRIVSFIVDFME